MAGPSPADIGYAFSLKPQQALEYLRGKGLRINEHWNWWDTWQDVNNRAFVVSKMTQESLLRDTQRIVADVLDDGGTLRTAAAELETAYRKAGWWGKVGVSGPDGATEIVQLGSMHRIRTILRTNMQSAYSAGRYRRQRETVQARPYWQYVAVLDGATRASHRKLNGLVMPADDPAWGAMYPPNGFNCRCRVRAITQREVDRLGLKVVRSADVVDITDRIGIDKRTGEVIDKPGKRIVWADAGGDTKEFRPDPGWSYPPGRLAA